jgi:hypothetical protein
MSHWVATRSSQDVSFVIGRPGLNADLYETQMLNHGASLWLICAIMDSLLGRRITLKGIVDVLSKRAVSGRAPAPDEGYVT